MKKSETEKINELYDWYSYVKPYVKAWELLLSWTVMGLVAILFTIAFVETIEGTKRIWPQISLDAKFQAVIAAVIFVLGVIIGRRIPKRGRSQGDNLTT